MACISGYSLRNVKKRLRGMPPACSNYYFFNPILGSFIEPYAKSSNGKREGKYSVKIKIAMFVKAEERDKEYIASSIPSRNLYIIERRHTQSLFRTPKRHALSAFQFYTVSIIHYPIQDFDLG